MNDKAIWLLWPNFLADIFSLGDAVSASVKERRNFPVPSLNGKHL